jgi:hypothetical protein
MFCNFSAPNLLAFAAGGGARFPSPRKLPGLIGCVLAPDFVTRAGDRWMEPKKWGSAAALGDGAKRPAANDTVRRTPRIPLSSPTARPIWLDLDRDGSGPSQSAAAPLG